MNTSSAKSLTGSLRPFTETDLPQVLEIEKKAQKIPWTADFFKQELEKPYSQSLVFTDDESDSLVMGYVCFWEFDDRLEILNVTVNPEFWRQKIATKMLQSLLRDAVLKGFRNACLEVRKSNLPAILLYQRFGFEVRQVRKNFYSDGEDAYFMVRELTAPGTRDVN